VSLEKEEKHLQVSILVTYHQPSQWILWSLPFSW